MPSSRREARFFSFVLLFVMSQVTIISCFKTLSNHNFGRIILLQRQQRQRHYRAESTTSWRNAKIGTSRMQQRRTRSIVRSATVLYQNATMTMSKPLVWDKPIDTPTIIPSRDVSTPPSNTDGMTSSTNLCHKCASQEVQEPHFLSQPRHQVLDKLTEVIMGMSEEDRKELISRVLLEANNSNHIAAATSTSKDASVHKDPFETSRTPSSSPSPTDTSTTHHNSNVSQLKSSTIGMTTPSAVGSSGHLVMNQQNQQRYSKILQSMKRAGEQMIEQERRLIRAKRLLRVATVFLKESSSFTTYHEDAKKRDSHSLGGVDYKSSLRLIPLPNVVYDDDELLEIDLMRSMTRHELDLQRCKYVENKIRFERARMQCRSKQYAASLQLARLKALERQQWNMKQQQQPQNAVPPQSQSRQQEQTWGEDSTP